MREEKRRKKNVRSTISSAKINSVVEIKKNLSQRKRRWQRECEWTKLNGKPQYEKECFFLTLTHLNFGLFRTMEPHSKYTHQLTNWKKHRIFFNNCEFFPCLLLFRGFTSLFTLLQSFFVRFSFLLLHHFFACLFIAFSSSWILFFFSSSSAWRGTKFASRTQGIGEQL